MGGDGHQPNSRDLYALIKMISQQRWDDHFIAHLGIPMVRIENHAYAVGNIAQCHHKHIDGTYTQCIKSIHPSMHLSIYLWLYIRTYVYIYTYLGHYILTQVQVQLMDHPSPWLHLPTPSDEGCFKEGMLDVRIV